MCRTFSFLKKYVTLSFTPAFEFVGCLNILFWRVVKKKKITLLVPLGKLILCIWPILFIVYLNYTHWDHWATTVQHPGTVLHNRDIQIVGFLLKIWIKYAQNSCVLLKYFIKKVFKSPWNEKHIFPVLILCLCTKCWCWHISCQIPHLLKKTFWSILTSKSGLFSD